MSGSPQFPRGGGGQHEEDEKKGKERKRKGALQGNVCLEFTQRAHCVFWSVTIPFYELSGVFSDSEQS